MVEQRFENCRKNFKEKTTYKYTFNIIPASQTIYSEALKEGLIKIFVMQMQWFLLLAVSVCWCARGFWHGEIFFNSE